MSDLLSSFNGFERVLFYIAVPFTLLTLVQLVMEILGLGGHDVDVAVDGAAIDAVHGDASGFGVFTVRNVIYFFTMFGWSGIAASKAGLSVFPTILIATFAGAATSLLIAYIFFLLSKLSESGNVRIQNAVGAHGTVYLHIPPSRSGSGLVQISLQGMTVELTAMTDGEELKTGLPVRVVEVLDGRTVVVSRVESDRPRR